MQVNQKLWSMLVGATIAGALTATDGFGASASAEEPRQAQVDPKNDKDKSKSRQSKLDNALLDDLDNELLEGAGDLKRPTALKKAEGAKSGAASKEDAPIGDEDTSIPREDEQSDPLVQVSQDMRTVEELIPKAISREHAEELQRRIVEDLAKLIEQAEAQRAAQQAASGKKKQPSSAKRQGVKQSKPTSQANSQQNSNKPAQDSTNRLGKADEARPDPELMKGLMKDSWGNLPPRAREQMLQNSPERFLPQYELMIERYYQRLAEESGSK